MQTTSEKYQAARQLILDATGVLATIKSKDESVNHFEILRTLDKVSYACNLAANKIFMDDKD